MGPGCAEQREERCTASGTSGICSRCRQVICPSGGLSTDVSSPLCKNISVFTPPKSHLELRASHPTRGALAIVTNAGRDAVDAAASCARWGRRAGRKTCERFPCTRTRGDCCERRSRVVLTPRRWRQVRGWQVGPTGLWTSHTSAGDGGKRARSPGRARRKPLKPLRAGMPGDSGVLVVTRVRSINTKCTRGCGCSGHPAFPTPSVFRARDSSTARAHRAARP
jgi:hypothetical protein